MTSQIIRRTAHLSASALLAGASVLVGASAASASPTGSCSGSRIDTQYIQADNSDGTAKTTVGYIALYYNSSSGKNCMKVITSGAGTSGTKGIDAFLDATTPSGVVVDSADDTGPYTSYAGPIYVNGRGHCVKTYATIHWRGQQVSAGHKPYHCG